MPLVWILGALVLGGLFLVTPTVLGYVQGKPVQLKVAGIGDHGCVLRFDAASSWLRMKAEAASEGVELKPEGPRSAFRTTEQQAELEVERPDFAAPIGHSPHQAGIAVDVDLSGSSALDWLLSNAQDFDWYPLPGTGATKEPWHWEYHPSSTPMNVA